MNRLTRTSLIVAMIFAANAGGNALRAQNAPAKWADTISAEINNAVMSGEPADMESALALAERIAILYPDDGLIQHYAGYAWWRQGLRIASHAKGDAREPFDKARGYLMKSLRTHALPETHAMLATIGQYYVSRDTARAMDIGAAGKASAAMAASMAPDNPRVWLVRGENTFMAGLAKGGDMKAAADQLQHAVELYATDRPKAGDPAWGLAEAHVWLGQAYEKLGDRARAGQEYKAALQVAPRYSWARQLSMALLR